MSNEYILTKRKQNLYGSAEFTMPSREMTKEEIETGKSSEWYRLQLTGSIRHFPLKICTYTYITTLILKNNLLEKLPEEICQLENLKNLDASNNKLSSLPVQMGYMCELRHIYLNQNFISEIPTTFGCLHNLKSFDLTGNPLQGIFKKLYEVDTTGRNLVEFLLQTYYTHNKINAPPIRTWVNFDRPKDGVSFTLMCYNVLCQKYATNAQYPYCPSFALDWDYRKRGILEEIWKYNADIICLQELETSQYYNVFLPELKLRKYEGLFVPKSRYRTMTESDCKGVDGCAIFWKMDSFSKKHFFRHEFMLSVLNVSKSPSPELLNRVMNRDNVALSVILEAKDPKLNKKQFCVSNAHIHWDPEYSDVKLIQTIFWTSELWKNVIDYYKTNNINSDPSEMPVILCGDLNSLPDSGVIDYLMKGEVDRSHGDFKDLGEKYLFDEWVSLPDEFVENDALKHHFNFDRAYKAEEETGLKWTNYTYDFRGVIDYIFFTKDSLRLIGSLQQIPEEWFESQKIVGAPHVHINSDHFSLLVELELLNTPLITQQSQNTPHQNNTNSQHNKSSTTSTLQSQQPQSLSSLSTTSNTLMNNTSLTHHHHHHLHNHHHHHNRNITNVTNNMISSNNTRLKNNPTNTNNNSWS